jgi:hypothetical protein
MRAAGFEGFRGRWRAGVFEVVNVPLGLKASVDRGGQASLKSSMFLSATLENEADPTLENEATGSLVSSLPCLGF